MFTNSNSLFFLIQLFSLCTQYYLKEDLYGNCTCYSTEHAGQMMLICTYMQLVRHVPFSLQLAVQTMPGGWRGTTLIYWMWSTPTKEFAAYLMGRIFHSANIQVIFTKCCWLDTWANCQQGCCVETRRYCSLYSKCQCTEEVDCDEICSRSYSDNPARVSWSCTEWRHCTRTEAVKDSKRTIMTSSVLSKK